MGHLPIKILHIHIQKKTSEVLRLVLCMYAGQLNDQMGGKGEKRGGGMADHSNVFNRGSGVE